MTINEYSVAYEHKTEEDFALLSSDFIPCLEGLHEAENFDYAKNKLDKGTFEYFFAEDLLAAETLPENWSNKLSTYVAALKEGSLKLQETDSLFGIRRKRAAYQISYMQALASFMSYIYESNPDKPERKPYEPVLSLIENPAYYTPFKAALYDSE